MAYFPNATSAEMYEEQFCVSCAHYDDGACPVLLAHLIHNYDDCNSKDSALHILIPRSADGENQKCAMFIEARQ